MTLFVSGDRFDQSRRNHLDPEKHGDGVRNVPLSYRWDRAFLGSGWPAMAVPRLDGDAGIHAIGRPKVR